MVMVGTLYREVYNNAMDHQLTTCKVMAMGEYLTKTHVMNMQ
jgi:hypothetical protein